MAGNAILKDGELANDRYGVDLDKLVQDDRIGIVRSSEARNY